MKFDVVTIFPRMLQAPIEDGIVHRAMEAGIVSIGVHDLRALHRRPAPQRGRPAVRGRGRAW
jgi:tRNA (guanine-N1)-methyltransferase